MNLRAQESSTNSPSYGVVVLARMASLRPYSTARSIHRRLEMAPEVPARNAQRVSPPSCDRLLWPTSQRLWCAVAVISNSVGISINPSKALRSRL